MILRVRFEVFGQVADAVREKGDLHFGRAGVTVMGALVRNQFGFLLLGAWQDTVSLASYRQIGTRSLLSRDTITALTPKINPARRVQYYTQLLEVGNSSKERLQNTMPNTRSRRRRFLRQRSSMQRAAVKKWPARRSPPAARSSQPDAYFND